MHVRFLSRYEFRPPERPRTLIVYQPGWHGVVRKVLGEAAIASGDAVLIPTPTRDEAKAWRQGS